MIGKLIDRLDSFFGQLHFRYLGLGALLAWVYCTWFANATFGAYRFDSGLRYGCLHTLFASCREGVLRSCGAEYNRRHCVFSSLGGVG